jgi:hypothetical protein
VVLDEWASAEAFQTFFASPEIATVMQDAGAQGEPGSRSPRRSRPSTSSDAGRLSLVAIRDSLASA